MVLSTTSLRWQQRLLLLILPVLAIGLSSVPVIAFHEQGVANCKGCHIMHNSEDGTPVDPDNPPGNMRLLNDGTASDVCLSCHADQFGAVLATDPLAPPPERGPGNFVFLFEENINDGPDGTAVPIPGSDAGHNLRAPSFGLSTDSRHTHAPGGNFPANRMQCTSCHDAHGNTNYRMLHGSGRIPGSQGFSFMYDAPVAEGLPLTSGFETVNNHVAYQSGMDNWCRNCHMQIHQAGAMKSGPFIHVTNQAMSLTVITQYNQYNGTADPTGGTSSASYIPEVAFEDPANTINRTIGPSISSKVTCMSCHRAHATSAPDAGRWDFNVDLLWNDGMASGSYPIPSPYPSPNQGPLCEKCHEPATSGGSDPVFD